MNALWKKISDLTLTKRFKILAGTVFDIPVLRATRFLPAEGAAASHSDAGGVTVTAAEVLGGVIVADPNGAGRTYTWPTAALLVAAMKQTIGDVVVGDKITTLVVNGADAAENLTIAAGAGGGFDANQTAASRVVAQNGSKPIVTRITNATAGAEAYVIYC